MTTRAEAIAAAGAVLAADRAERNALPPRMAAERAYCPGGPSIEQLEAQIRRHRAQAQQDTPEPSQHEEHAA